MCNECWKEFRGWCKSFTRTEALLAVLEAILLIVCVAFLVFVIGHLIVCGARVPQEERGWVSTAAPGPAPAPSERHEGHGPPATLPPGVECTWKPSEQTAAGARHYHEAGEATAGASRASPPPPPPPGPALDALDRLAADEQSDGVAAAAEYVALVLALVRRRAGAQPLFGCPLTALGEHWALTAASCLDAVDEADSLDAYVMVERWGEAPEGRAHEVADVSVHPRYGAQPRAHDVAALRSPDPLLRGARPPRLASLPDYFLLTIGERLTVLGFGPFRAPGQGPRALREARVYSLGARQCSASAGDGGGWASRHLWRGRPRQHGACSHGALCAGVLLLRTALCGYCAGTPLLRGRTLLAVASAAPCGEACEPAPYVNLAMLRDWIDDLLFHYGTKKKSVK